MSKRQAEDIDVRDAKSAMLEDGPVTKKGGEDLDGMGEFEDAWEDDLEDEDEEEVVERGEDGLYRAFIGCFNPCDQSEIVAYKYPCDEAIAVARSWS
ncbi:hypothetical protein BC938DRAFT_483225 [Jimgerdemannia flammicorona]|uniref:Uncharacterized protein n=1 Tax=Jimgerdemannia flammicorona TaxID=994334 RepID=A0A433QCC0_9FUNG|nr:hypothetical protein BC938DRAFT_483225 [Jimgerdemannia flammicorona]